MKDRDLVCQRSVLKISWKRKSDREIMRSHLDMFTEVPVRASGRRVCLVWWGFMPRPWAKGKDWRFAFGNYKGMGATVVMGMRMDAQDKSPLREHLRVTLK